MINLCVAAHGEVGNLLLARRFVSRLSGECRIFLGGYWGIMKDVADEAMKRNIPVVFILPHDATTLPPKNKLFTIIDTGLDRKGRSVILVRSSDVVAALGGEVGTLIEIFLAYSYAKPVFVLKGTGMSTDRLESAFGDYLDRRKMSRVVYVDTPEELAELVSRYSHLSKE